VGNQRIDLCFNNLPKLIIKKTNRDLGFKSVYGRKLSKEQLADLKATILSNPKEYVAQEEVSLSQLANRWNSSKISGHSCFSNFRWN
jgi:uncharacterized circularly permuted ATP-grasp superfamily protein